MKTNRKSRRRRWLINSAAVLLEPVAMKPRGYRIAGTRWSAAAKVTCSRRIRISGAALKAVRFGWWRLQRCPVGNHWSIRDPGQGDRAERGREAGRERAQGRPTPPDLGTCELVTGSTERLRTLTHGGPPRDPRHDEPPEVHPGDQSAPVPRFGSKAPVFARLLSNSYGTEGAQRAAKLRRHEGLEQLEIPPNRCH
jgi:hypothetical protein